MHLNLSSRKRVCKMNDKEIIKALECCTGHHRGCNTCAYYGGERPCTQRLEADALKLIRRQQEEINHFAEVNKMVVDLKTVKNDDEEILRLLVNQGVKFIPKNDDIKAIQRDAVVNFAEKLKAYLLLTRSEQISVVSYEDIDKLVNEMFPKLKGEENGHRKN